MSGLRKQSEETSHVMLDIVRLIDRRNGSGGIH